MPFTMGGTFRNTEIVALRYRRAVTRRVDHAPAKARFRLRKALLKTPAPTSTGRCTTHLHSRFDADNQGASRSLSDLLATGRVLARSCYNEPPE
ncbi:hypothetical protein GCM10023192_10070 [Amycolatopsis samaneae]